MSGSEIFKARSVQKRNKQLKKESDTRAVLFQKTFYYPYITFLLF